MKTSIEIDDDLRDWLMEHRGAGTVSSMIMELIEFKEQHTVKTQPLTFCDGELRVG